MFLVKHEIIAIPGEYDSNFYPYDWATKNIRYS